MSYGLSVFRGSNVIQIDDTYDNYVYWKKGSANYGAAVDLAAPSNYEVICVVRPNGSERLFVHYDGSQGGLLCTTGSNPYQFENTGIYHYAVYIKASIYGPASNYGLLVKRSNGEIVFDSGRLPLKVDGVLNIALSNYEFSAQSISLGSLSSLDTFKGVIAKSCQIAYLYPSQFKETFWGIRFSGSTAYIDCGSIYANAGAVSIYQPNPFTLGFSSIP